MWVHIDLPVFSSPTEAYGWFSGDLEIDAEPTEGVAFPWPSTWLNRFGNVFTEQRNQVWGVTKWASGKATRHIAMHGLVADDRQMAAALAAHIEAVSGLDFSHHDLPELSDE